MKDSDQKFYKKIIEIINNEKLDPIQRNFEMGKEINEQGRKNKKEKGLIENLSSYLSKYLKEEGDTDIGISKANLSNMQRFYRRFRSYPDLFEFTRELDWTKIGLLLKLSDIKETEFYLKSAEEMANLFHMPE